MTAVPIKNALGETIYIEMSGTGTELDPYIANHVISDIDGNIANVTDGAVDVAMQDQDTPTVIAKFNRVTNQTTLANPAVQFANTIVVADATGITSSPVSSYLILFDPVSVRFSLFNVTNVAGTTITLDSPIDFAYPAGTFVDVTVTNMNVNGSVTPQVYGLRGTGSPPGVALEVDITRLIFKCFTTSAPQLNQFGNITKLVNGLVCRKRDGNVFNIFNVKDNGELAGIMFDWTPTSAIGSGQDGFISRLTFGGPSKIGVVQRLALGEDLEMIIQDDLSTGSPNIELLEIVAEGHIVEE